MSSTKQSPFHTRPIKQGTYGDLSKIQEELDEALDAFEQGVDLMVLIELSDIIGAVAGFAEKHYGFSLDQLITFSEKVRDVRKEEAGQEETEEDPSGDRDNIENTRTLISVFVTGREYTLPVNGVMIPGIAVHVTEGVNLFQKAFPSLSEEEGVNYFNIKITPETGCPYVRGGLDDDIVLKNGDVVEFFPDDETDYIKVILNGRDHFFKANDRGLMDKKPIYYTKGRELVKLLHPNGDANAYTVTIRSDAGYSNRTVGPDEEVILAEGSVVNIHQTGNA